MTRRGSTSISTVVKGPKKLKLGFRARSASMARSVRTWTVDPICCRLVVFQFAQATAPQVMPPFYAKDRSSHEYAGSPILRMYLETEWRISMCASTFLDPLYHCR